MEYTTIPTADIVQKTVESMKTRNFNAMVVNNKDEALQKIKELIPAGASVMNGSSTTLKQIGLIDYLTGGQHGWNNLHDAIVNEKDPAKEGLLRKQALLSDYYLGSAHAVTEDGQIVIASNSGSQLPHVVYSSPNVILVVSTMKITPNLDAALKRLRDHVVPLEDQRMKDTGASGTKLSQTLILTHEAEYKNRNFTVLFVNEQLGF